MATITHSGKEGLFARKEHHPTLFDQMPKPIQVLCVLTLIYGAAASLNESRGQHKFELFHEKNATNESFGIKEAGYNTEMMSFFDDDQAEDGDWTLKKWRGGNLRELFTAWTITKFDE